MTFDYEFTPLEELKYSAESLSDVMLSTVNTAAGVAARLSGLMPNIISGFMSSKVILSKMDEKNTASTDLIKDITKDQREFIEKINRIGFSSARELKAWQPEGVIVKHLDYLKVLKKYTSAYMSIEKTVIDPYLYFLAQLVADPKALLSSDNSHAVFAKKEKERDEMFAEFGKLYKKDSYRSEVTMKDVVDRNADWVDIFILLKKCNDEVASIGRTSIAGKVQQAVTYLDIIKKNLEASQMDRATAEVAQKLSEGAYSVACDLQAMATVYYRVLAITGSVKNTIDQTKRIAI